MRLLSTCLAATIALLAGCGTGGRSGSRQDPSPRVAITPPFAVMGVGATVPLDVTVEDPEGRPIAVAAGDIEWRSESPGVAVVDAAGTVTGVAGGAAAITATYVPARVHASVPVSVIADPRDAPLLTWQRGDRPITPAGRSFGNIVWDPVTSKWRMYYQRLKNDGTDTILGSVSSDGLAWTGEMQMLGPGDPEAWDGGDVGVPFVWREPGQARPWRMLYRGRRLEPRGAHQIGLATSTDGVQWDRLDTRARALTKPVIPVGPEGAWDYASLDFGASIKVDGTYYLYYDTIGMPRRETGLATSTDLVSWRKHPKNPLFVGTSGPDVEGVPAVPAMGRFCPDIVRWDRKDGSKRYVLFMPHYAADQTVTDLEVYTASSPVLLRSDRAYAGVVRIAGNTRPAKYDTPRITCDGIERVVAAPARTGDVLWMSVGVSTKGWSTEVLRHSHADY